MTMKKLTIKITSATRSTSWYANKIGQTFSVVESEFQGRKCYERLFNLPIRDFWPIEKNLTGSYIELVDAEIID